MREADRFQRCQLCGGYIDVFDLAWSGSRRPVAASCAGSNAVGSSRDVQFPEQPWRQTVHQTRVLTEPVIITTAAACRNQTDGCAVGVDDRRPGHPAFDLSVLDR